MTTKEIQKRNERAQQLKVLQTGDGNFYVESSEGKILYRVFSANGDLICSCGDFARGIKSDPNFRCKHLMAVESCIPNGDVKQAEFLEKRKPKLDDRFITTIKGRDFVIYSGLLDLAHQKGLLKLDVEPIQYPTKENGNEAICKATVESKTGEVFTDIGDANPKNCTSEIAPHLIRMSATRAKARALRDFTNIGMTCLEELGDLDSVIGADPSVRRSTSNRSTTRRQTKPSPPKAEKEEPPTKEEPPAKDEPKETETPKKEEPQPAEQPTQTITPRMSEAQKRAVYNLSRRRGISVEELEKMSVEAYGVSVENLSSVDASSFIRTLQQSA
jgi:hypothetical protein